MTSNKVLSGVRVVEVATHAFTPSAGAILADWGADVVKIEHPVTGDPLRGLKYGAYVSDIDWMFEHHNRGKRSIGLDISRPEGRDVLGELVATADVFLTSYLTPVRQKLRIDVEDVREWNANIVYARGSGQGVRGPEAVRGGFDGTSFWARSGLAHSLTAEDQEYPVQGTAALGDTPGGTAIAAGIAGALFHRERTGESIVVDVSLFATGLWAMSSNIVAADVLDLQDIRPPRREDTNNPLSIMFRTADGRFLKLSMFQSDRYWAPFCELAGCPELIDDHRFDTASNRNENSTECVAELDKVFARRSLAEWIETFGDFDGAWAVVQTPRETLSDVQVLANGYVSRVETSYGVDVPLVCNPVQYAEMPVQLQRAPEHAEHTEEVLLELGYSWEDIAGLQAAGVLP